MIENLKYICIKGKGIRTLNYNATKTIFQIEHCIWKISVMINAYQEEFLHAFSGEKKVKALALNDVLYDSSGGRITHIYSPLSSRVF